MQHLQHRRHAALEVGRRQSEAADVCVRFDGRDCGHVQQQLELPNAVTGAEGQRLVKICVSPTARGHSLPLHNEVQTFHLQRGGRAILTSDYGT